MRMLLPASTQGIGTPVSFRDFAKRLVAPVLCALGVPQLARRQLQGKLAILMFHGIEALPLSPACPHVLDAASLRRYLEYVARHFTVLPLDEALELLSTGKLPDRAATLTFDDGTRNLATTAAPILRDLGLPAAVFLATGPMGTQETLWPDRLWLGFARTELTYIDLTALGLGIRPLRDTTDRTQAWQAVLKQFKNLPDQERIERVESLIRELGPDVDIPAGPFEMLSWDEARALKSTTHTSLYPHSVTHPILSRCTTEKVDYEISESCVTLERETGEPPEIFAYPNGHIEDFDERAKEALRRNGIRWALSTTRGFANKDSDPFELPRVLVDSEQSFALFRLNVSGALPLSRLRKGFVGE
jgi:peptidoglycan/xylan/chitin deacetylase (PgdA/CDA1 family)